MHKIGKLFENGFKTTLCFSTSNLPNFYIFWVPNVVKKCQKKQQRGASLTPRGRKQGVHDIYLPGKPKAQKFLVMMGKTRNELFLDSFW